MPYLVILGCKFEKVFIFEISILEFVQMQSFVRNQKPSLLVQKMPDLGVFRLQF